MYISIIPATELAEYIIAKCQLLKRCPANIDLQKILYILQRHYLQKYNKLLFSEEIVATKAGPCVREVYYKYCYYGAMPIKIFRDNTISILHRTMPNDINVTELDSMIEIYCDWLPWSLSSLIDFSDSAYRKAITKNQSNSIMLCFRPFEEYITIPIEDIKNDKIPEVTPEFWSDFNS